MKRSSLLIFLLLLLTPSLLLAEPLSAPASNRRSIMRDHNSQQLKALYHRKAARSKVPAWPKKLQTTTPRVRLSTQQVLQSAVQGSVSVNLAPSTPLLTAVDPYANAANSADGLKPYRPFWYSVDQKGLTILRIEDNALVYFVPWPTTIAVVQPDGEYVDVSAPAAGWEPVAMTVTYPTDEALASNSETPPTMVYVVMAHSGFRWESETDPTILQSELRDSNLRDKLVATTDPNTESSMLVSVDVTDPTFDPAENAAGPIIAAAILGHGAGQLAYDPGTDFLYVGNLQSTSLPTNLQSFVSVISALAPPVAEPAGAGPPVPEAPLVNVCGPEHPDEGLLIGEPYVWACVESGDGPSSWEFQGLPSWVTAHKDKLTGQLDGLLYGLPTTNGTWTYQARVTDYADLEAGPLTSDWVTFTLNVIPTGVASEVEAGFEAGIPGGQGIAGTGICTPAPTSSLGSIVPAWIDVQPALVNGVVKGCYVMGTAPISGEYYEFALPNFQFVYPYDREPVIFSGNVVGPYIFDPLPAGVSISGLAWHQIEKIHDPSTEADVLNVEFIGVDPLSGQLYRILPPQGAIEGSGGDAAVGPPEISVEPDQIMTEGTPLLSALQGARPELTGSVAFGDLVVEADRDIYISVPWMLDSVSNSFTPIGGAPGTTIPNGALVKVSGTSTSVIDLPNVQALYLGLDSNLAPAIPGVEPGQKDNGLLWITGTNTGNVAIVDTTAGTVQPPLAVSGANSLGGVSVDSGIGAAYVAGGSLGTVTIFGSGTHPQRAPVIWSGAATQLNVGSPGSFTVMATGLPTPRLSLAGTLPSGVTFTDNGSGTATLGGTPAIGTQGDYSLTMKATNGVSPDASQDFILTIGAPPLFTSANTTTFTVGIAGSFMVTTNGSPTLTVLWCTDGVDPAGACTLPAWLAFVDNEDGTSSFTGTPPPGSEGNYAFTLWASTGVPPDASQAFTLVVKAGSGGTDTAPLITSANTTTFTVGSPASFQFTATGTPTPALTEVGALPSGVIFVDNHNGTAALAGTPAAGAQGTYPLTITAANGILPNATQTFTIVVNATSQAIPVITSGNATTFEVGAAGSFTVTATGTPAPTLSHWGTLPIGVTFTDNANGSAALAGTPAAGTQGSYPFTITAANIVGSVTQYFTLTVNPAPTTPPVVTMHPTSQAVNIGQAATFSAAATGTPTPTVQWELSTDGVGWSNIGGATNLSYTTPAATASMSGYRYQVVFNNSAGTAYSNTAMLTVNTPPVLTAQPANQTVTAGQAATFTASASGSPTPTVQWEMSTNGGSTWSSLVGATNASYTTPTTTVAMNGYRYRAVFTNSVGSATSNAAILTVNPPDVVPSVTAHPASQTVTAGQRATFSAAANGSPTPTMQWQLSTNGGSVWSNITGATNSSYTTPTTTTVMNGYQYRAVFTNRAGTATSNAATLTVNAQIPALAISTTSLPAGAVSRSYSQQLQAQGGTSPYTWSVGTGLPPGLTLSSSGLISGTPGAQGNYRFTVQVTDSATRTASRSLTLRVARR